MTRFARASSGNKKKPSDASSWLELKKTPVQNKEDHQQTVHHAAPNQRIKSKSSFKHKQLNKKKFGKETRNNFKYNTDTTRSHPGSNSEQSQSFRQEFAESSKSLIDELEEMDRQQMAEVRKLEIGNKKTNGMHSRIDSSQEESSSGEYAKQVNRKEKRREERRLKRQKVKSNKMVCYHCRESGHGVADCPKALEDAEQGSGVCYRCGSTEHDSSQCTARIDPNQGEFPFAKCFICQEMGHLSKSCPDNPKGLYPMGGCCKHCESVEHMSWNCPHNKKLKGAKEVHVSTLSSMSHQSADAELFEVTRRAPVLTKKKHKIVKF